MRKEKSEDKKNLRLRDGCRFWQAEFVIGGKTIYFSTRKTVKSEALQAVRERRKKEELKLAAETMRRLDAAAGRETDPVVATIADGDEPGRFGAERVSKKYWAVHGQFTANKEELAGLTPHVLDLLGRKTDLAELDDLAMKEFKRKLILRGPLKPRLRGKAKKDHETLTAKTKNKYTGMVYTLWNFAKNLMHMKPRHALDPKQWREREPITTREIGYFEEARFYAQCRKIRPELKDIYDFGVASCVRRKALCELTWKQVADDCRHITVSLKGKGNEKVQHRVFLGDDAVKILLAQKGRHKKYVFTLIAECPTKTEDGLVPTGGRIPVKPHYFGRLMRQCFDAAGLTDLTVHHLRHTGATRLLRYTGKLEVVRMVLGHTTDKCTKRYAALVKEDVENAMVFLSAMQSEARARVQDKLARHSEDDVVKALALGDAGERALRKAASEALRRDMHAAAFAYASAA
ncbi:MAG: tyrosine-type recombinase/integrase [Proteobacteria bacterium]|nr:tyrosine-type recombinase/integrase [Pseudomonadota bacterium]